MRGCRGPGDIDQALERAAISVSCHAHCPCRARWCAPPAPPEEYAGQLPRIIHPGRDERAWLAFAASPDAVGRRSKRSDQRGVSVREQEEGIRVGVVGVGYWGSWHLRVLRSTTGVASVAGIDPQFASLNGGSRQADHGIPVYADIEEALPDIDAVIIATPPASHAPLSLKAIAASKHVLVEKPLATTTRAARSAGRGGRERRSRAHAGPHFRAQRSGA